MLCTGWIPTGQKKFPMTSHLDRGPSLFPYSFIEEISERELNTEISERELIF